MAFDGFSLGKMWRRWFGGRSGKRQTPLLRLTIAPRSLGPAWHPAKGPGGQPLLQVLIELVARNVTDRNLRIARAELKDHRVEQASFTVGPLDDDHSQPDAPVPARGVARITLMFFLRPQPYRAGEAFADVVTLIDEDGGQHRLKVVMRGR